MFDVTRVPLAEHTTLRLGGPATELVVATDQEQLVAFVREGPAVLLAGGSNVVISDSGVDGRVVLVRSTGIRAERAGDDRVRLTVQAGHVWDEVVQYAVSEGLAGLECLSGIPGSAGATPIQNVGAYGQEVAESIVAVRVLDRTDDEVRELTPAQCGFAYRSSIFKGNGRYVVLAVTFELRRARVSEPVRYAELARVLGIGTGGRAPLADVREAVLALRASKGMVLDPQDPDTCSVGSFFVNPVLNPVDYANLRQRCLGTVGSEPIAWPADGGAVKVSAAWLIERAGFQRGYQGEHRGVAVSSKHTLALTNRGDGSTAALLALAREIRDGVRKAFDVELRPEPVLINCAL
ncbi:MAG TPA: UDP-N-acetylmuramate dehydrogenase [Micromonosporaceae bacterium]|nr:UDP-N-acetylmuramate dehydrogenase [Micromonosporaceae bacterium]